MMALEACGDTARSPSPPPSPPPSPDWLLVSGNISVADISATDWVLGDISKVRRPVKPSQAPGDTGVTRRENGSLPAGQMETTGRDCFPNQTKEAILESRTLPESHQGRLWRLKL
ncbi:unnamed protein product [Arctogadus glacialis]